MELPSRKKEFEKETASLETAMSSDLWKEIERMFLMYDELGNKTVDVRHLENVVRGLGCVPSEVDLAEMRRSMELPEKGDVNIIKLVPVVFNMICEGRMKPAEKEDLYMALKALDVEGKGCLSRVYLEQLLSKEGEPFTPEETDRMMRLAVEPDSGTVDYGYYVNQLVVRPDIYDLVPEEEAVRASERKATIGSLKED